jgi:hypothetical protein
MDEQIQQPALLGPDVGYLDIVNEHFREKAIKAFQEGTNFQKTPLRPSAAGNCTRELAYQLMEFHKFAKYEKEPTSPELDRIFKMGHSVESLMIRDMREAYKELFEIKYTQQSLSFAFLKATNNPDLSQWLEGSTDLVIIGKKYKCIADWKSKKDKFSSYRESAWSEFEDKLSRMRTVRQLTDTAFYMDDVEAFLNELRDPFLAANFLQLNLYALNPFIVERGIDHASVFQFNKNDSRIRELRFRPSQKLYDYVIYKMQAALDAADHKEPERAEREFPLGSIKCAFCDYRKTCWPSDDPLRLYFKTLPPKQWPTDTSRLGDAGEVLEELHSAYKLALLALEDVNKLEQEMINVTLETEKSKIRFADGEIYEVKLYKSPNEHFKWKRSKM